MASGALHSFRTKEPKLCGSADDGCPETGFSEIAPALSPSVELPELRTPALFSACILTCCDESSSLAICEEGNLKRWALEDPPAGEVEAPRRASELFLGPISAPW